MSVMLLTGIIDTEAGGRLKLYEAISKDTFDHLQKLLMKAESDIDFLVGEEVVVIDPLVFRANIMTCATPFAGTRAVEETPLYIPEIIKALETALEDR